MRSQPIPVAARSNACVYGRSFVGVAGSNPAADIDICIWWMLCDVRYRSLWRAEHSSRGVLPTVVRHCVWSRNIKREEVLARIGPQRHRKQYVTSQFPTSVTCSITCRRVAWQMFNTLNAELKPICHFLALLGAHHIFHVSRIRVNGVSEKPAISFSIFYPVWKMKKFFHNIELFTPAYSASYHVTRIFGYVQCSFMLN